MSEQPIDPYLGIPVEVRVVQPFQANKEYICPGCEHTVAVGIGHVVTVPYENPDLRRHWHKSCWQRRDSRRAGRR